MSTDTTHVDIGSEFLGYRIEELIGRGGMGVVYRAYDLRLKRTVALKLVSPELALDQRFRERFARETEVAMSLEHPNVVPVYDAGDVDGRLYLAMRLVGGIDLRKLLASDGPLEPPRAVAICSQVANALDAAHAMGLVHRDVKPSNVLLDENEHAYLADFGLTRGFEEQGTQAGEGRSIGTPAYLAPEQIEAKPVDGRADVYALGCLLFEGLTGKAPYVRSSRLAVAWAHMEEEPPRASELNSDLPQAVDPVIAKAMAKEPDDRYPTCAGLTAAVEGALGLRKPSARRLARRLVATALVAAVVAATAAVLLTRGGAAPTVVPNSLVKIDTKTNKIVDVIPVGRGPGKIAVVGDYVFVTSDDGTLTRVDRRTDAVVNSGKYDADDGLAAEGGHRLWVGSVNRRLVTSVDPELPIVVPEDRVRGPHLPVPSDTTGISLAVGGGSLWIATTAGNRSPVVERWLLHPVRRQATYRLRQRDFGVAVAFGYGAAWVALGDPADALLRIDAPSGHAIRIPVGKFPIGVTTGFRAVWVPQANSHSVRRIDPATGRTQGIIPVGNGPAELAVGAGSIWVANNCDGTVTRLDPRGNGVAKTIETGLYPRWLAAGDGFVWVGVSGTPDLFGPCAPH